MDANGSGGTSNIGVLKLKLGDKLIINDGQHRCVGIAAALKENPQRAAIVVRLSIGTLVGIHKTQQWHNHTMAVFNRANNLIGAIGGHIRDLHILGWNMDDPTLHDINQIRGTLNCNNVPTYTFNYSNHGATSFKAPRSFGDAASDLCTFAEYNGNGRPDFWVKRTTSVTCARDANAYTNFVHNNEGYQNARYMAFTETVDVEHRHPIRWLDFTRV